MIKVTIPKNNILERKYILDIIFNEFLGLEYLLEKKDNCKHWYICLENDKKLIIEDHFFNQYPKDLAYLHVENLPLHVKYIVNSFTHEKDIPVIYGTSICKVDEKCIQCGIDIFASSFFMLTRWEEYVNKKRDEHDRFPGVESLAYKQDFLNRPVVNEYTQMLKNMLLSLDKALVFKKHTPKTYISCDIDQPFDCTVETIPRLLRACGGDIIKRKSIKQLLKRIRRFVFNNLGNYKYDKNYTFDWYMDRCENKEKKVAFYFIAENNEVNNGCYSLNDRKIQKLIKHIDNRGHEIGIHGSYQTYQDNEKAKKQKNILENILKSLSIAQKIIGNRQHYLRWDSAITPSILEYVGIEYDTTGSYADQPGFRYGVCYDFSMFDFLHRHKLNLKQCPLIVMECSVIDEQYLGLGYSDKALNLILDLKSKCYYYEGNFVLLWHNSHLKTQEDKEFFQEILDA